MNQLLEVEYVHFPSRRDTYRVRLDTADGDVPFKLWLENKHRKTEWVGVFSDESTIKGKELNHAVPLHQVVSMLKAALLASCTKPDQNESDVTVDLKDEPHDHVRVEMTVMKPPSRYSFHLTPADVAATAKLEDQVHALEDQLEELKRTTLESHVR
ncbi:hypothetical protein H310_11712 [Aphanomyces invadans]|uniref:Uncharacterized protein n=1 Tax=Aphanomyces invadans TaxID=157072 RepID=A0A024TKS0_9STRA|nr:hypothetical protein H310_11712 [Aphanomyces invadans]ETV94750.1 hypothetical protein H310_11712 [Aphanomyces invadans]|eukprot:XP_008876695.1 hypothetical protein H310_11712 [Aphanomyces invadans]